MAALSTCIRKELVSFLIGAGAGPEDTTYRSSPLLTAVEFVDLVGALQALLEQGANPNRRGREGETALHRLGVSVRYKKFTGQCQLHETGVRLLLRYGACVIEEDKRGNTPLHFAAFGSNSHIFSLFVDHLPPCFQDPAVWVDMKNDKGETLLQWAAAGKSLDVMRFLIERGANVNSLSDNSWSPLMRALTPSLKYGWSIAHDKKAVQAATFLLEHSADPGVQTGEFCPPLHCLAQHEDDDDQGEFAAMATHLIRTGGRSVPTRATLPRGGSSGAIGLWGSLGLFRQTAMMWRCGSECPSLGPWLTAQLAWRRFWSLPTQIRKLWMGAEIGQRI